MVKTRIEIEIDDQNDLNKRLKQAGFVNNPISLKVENGKADISYVYDGPDKHEIGKDVFAFLLLNLATELKRRGGFVAIESSEVPNNKRGNLSFSIKGISEKDREIFQGIAFLLDDIHKANHSRVKWREKYNALLKEYEACTEPLKPVGGA